MKKVLIISPYFAPSNAADMQRIRMSLPSYKQHGWDAEIVTVDERFSDMPKDDLLLKSIPDYVKIYKVKAFDKKWTAKFGLGSLALRSLWFYLKKVNQLLKRGHYDLIYFSTTQFPVCILGPYWKKKFDIPFVIDMQDPWHSDYYADKPKYQRPSKYWFSYRLNKMLEPIAMNSVDGLISVSKDYISLLQARYPRLAKIPIAIIPFGSNAQDLDIAKEHAHRFTRLLDGGRTNIVYIGRGGSDMHLAVSCCFLAVKKLMKDADLISKLKIHFIGTSYAAQGKGKATILPLAKKYGIEQYITEITDRISYYHTLATLQTADALFIPGSDDPGYTASKIYPYLLTKRPVLAIFSPKSPAMSVLKEFKVKYIFNSNADMGDIVKIQEFFIQVINKSITDQCYDGDAIQKYSSSEMTRRQCVLFDQAISCRK